MDKMIEGLHSAKALLIENYDRVSKQRAKGVYLDCISDVLEVQSRVRRDKSNKNRGKRRKISSSCLRRMLNKNKASITLLPFTPKKIKPFKGSKLVLNRERSCFQRKGSLKIRKNKKMIKNLGKLNTTFYGHFTSKDDNKGHQKKLRGKKDTLYTSSKKLNLGKTRNKSLHEISVNLVSICDDLENKKQPQLRKRDIKKLDRSLCRLERLLQHC